MEQWDVCQYKHVATHSCEVHDTQCEMWAQCKQWIQHLSYCERELLCYKLYLTTHSDPAAGLWGVVGSVAITETSLYHWTNWVTLIYHALSFVSHSIHCACILFGTCSLINQMAKVNKRLLNKRILSASQLFTVLNLTMQF